MRGSHSPETGPTLSSCIVGSGRSQEYRTKVHPCFYEMKESSLALESSVDGYLTYSCRIVLAQLGADRWNCVDTTLEHTNNPLKKEKSYLSLPPPHKLAPLHTYINLYTPQNLSSKSETVYLSTPKYLQTCYPSKGRSGRANSFASNYGNKPLNPAGSRDSGSFTTTRGCVCIYNIRNSFPFC